MRRRMKNGEIIWPDHPEDGSAEPAVVVWRYYGCIGIQQAGKEIILNYEGIRDLRSALLAAQKLGGPDQD